MRQDIVELYDEFTHAPLPRRVFMKRLAALVGGLAAAELLVPLLETNYASAQMVAPDEPRLSTERITFHGASGEMRGYLTRPREAGGKLPAVVVIHENRGLNPHIEDVARRLALDGFLAMAPDALSPLGGTPKDQDKAREMIGSLNMGNTQRDYMAAVAYLKGHSSSNGKVGCVGFCWGGGLANQMAVNSPDLSAAVAFYGRTPAAGDVPKIHVPLLLHYAGLDKRINAGVPGYEAALKKAGKQYTIHIYDGVNHAFHNDTSSARYNGQAAKLAWSRTVDFLKKTL